MTVCIAGRGAGLAAEHRCQTDAAEGDKFCPEHREKLDRVAASLRMRSVRPAVAPKAREPLPAAPKLSLDEGAAELAQLVRDRGDVTRARAAEIIGVPFTTLRHRAARALRDGLLFQTTTGFLTLTKPVDALDAVVATLRERGPMPRVELVAASGIDTDRVAAALVKGRRSGIVAHAVAGEPIRLAEAVELAA